MAKAPAKKPAKKTARKSTPKKRSAKKVSFWRRWTSGLVWWGTRGALAIVVLAVWLIVLFAFVNPPTTPYAFAESRRLDGIKMNWVPLEDIAPVMARSVVAAEDANFCLHWGFDMAAIRDALDDGAGRGASTISQQVVKNVYLWHGRSWPRKALEALLTPAVELVWSKRRVIEVYLNVAEFDEGVFGVGAASQHYFGVPPDKLSATQAARLAAILPAPKARSASKPTDFVRRRTRSIIDGAATIRADGRAGCFE